MIQFWYGEKWCAITGYEGRYMVSSWGRVWSHKAKAVLKATFKNRYLGVTLVKGSRASKKTIAIHNIVAKEFLEPSPGKGYIVHHKDHDKTNCRASNLAWATPSANQYYRHEHYRAKAV